MRPLIFLFSLSCIGSEKVLVETRQPPDLIIEQPTTGTQVYAGSEVEFIASVFINDGSSYDQFSYYWNSVTDTLCPPVMLDETLYAYCIGEFTELGSQTAKIILTKNGALAAEAEVEFEVIYNEPPSIEITAPQENAYFSTGALIEFVAQVSDTESTPDNLMVFIESSLDGVLASEDYATSSGEYSTAVQLSAGQHYITMTVTDESQSTDEASIIVNVEEPGPPDLSGVAIDPHNPTTIDTLTAIPQGWSDYTNDPEQYYFRWYILDEDDIPQLDPTEMTETYPASKTTKGDRIQVEVVPYNSIGEGDSEFSTTIEVLNTPPTPPTVEISPDPAQPGETLYCEGTDATDEDDDTISYEYVWLVNGMDIMEHFYILDGSLTSHGDFVECQVRAFDGEDYSAPVSQSLQLMDTIPPDSPQIDTPDSFLNSTSATVSGLCEANCNLLLYCNDSSLSWTESDTCASDGTFNIQTTLNQGLATTCYATCEDLAGNLSSPSNELSMEACSPSDSYESLGGDSSSTAIDQWSALHDDNSSTVTIQGNVLSDDTSDWYLISATDDVNQDLSDGRDTFRFAVEFTAGATDYAFTVYAGSPTELECSDVGYTSYDDYNTDVGDGAHPVPSDPQACGPGGSELNTCSDDSKDYYIHVFRKTAVSSCQEYEIAISNGAW